MSRQPSRQPDVKRPSGERLGEALAFVKQQRDASESLPHDPPLNDDYTKWERVTSSGVKDYFGEDSDEYRWAKGPPRSRPMVPPMADKTQVLRPYYLAVLNDKRVGLDSILARYETLGPPSADDVAAVRRSAKAFVSHGGQKRSLTLIEDFLRTLGVEPVVAEKRASEGRELHDNVDNYRRQSDFAVILLTKDIRGADDVWHPSGSVEVEVGELKTQFQGRVIYLKEEGVKLPGMVSTLVHETFTDDNMGPAYMKIVTELYGWGWLTISPPEAGVE